jgi:multisubunit Na+/H+ antiporter MnhG subunit
VSASLLLGSVVLVASVIAAWRLPPPRRRLNGAAFLLSVIAVVDCVIGTVRGYEGRALLAVAVVASAVATWLLRAPADDDDDEGGEPPPEPDPDAPDPSAFDWDEFERARQAGRPGDPVPR